MKPLRTELSPDGGTLLALYAIENGAMAVITYRLDEKTGDFLPTLTHIYEVGAHGAFFLAEMKVHRAA